MTRTRWASLLGLYAVLATASMVVLGGQVPPCFGAVPTGEISAACYNAWQASRSWLDRLFDTPLGGLVVFVALAVGTWGWQRLAKGRP